MPSSRTMDMTEGPIARQLLSFAAPMLLGLIFQQLYNTVDTIVVGNFVSAQALAAVGTTGPLINSLLGFFNGFSAFRCHSGNPVPQITRSAEEEFQCN